MSIKHAILGLLSWKSSSGYDLKKIFEESSSMYWSGNNNQIYKALLELQHEGFVTNETLHRDGSPSKKVYSITDTGLNELKKWILSPSEAPEFKKTFLIQLAWSELLSNVELLDILSGYENEVRMQLLIIQEKVRRGQSVPGRSKRESLIWDMIDENMISSYKSELNWITELRGKLQDNLQDNLQHKLSDGKEV